MESNKLFVMQSNYIPWKGYFDAINMVDKFVIYDSVQYTKNDWRNRNIIKTKQGKQWLTIPVKQNSLDQRINETLISQHNWNIKHWKTIKQNYSKAPYFQEILDLLEDLYLGIDTKSLSDINLKFITRICEYLNIDTEIIDDRTLNVNGDKNERLIQMCDQLKCNYYLSAPAAKNYMDITLFNKNNIEVEFLDYSGYTEYEQFGEEFEHGVTILDLLFNKGTGAKNYMKSFNKNG